MFTLKRPERNKIIYVFKMDTNQQPKFSFKAKASFIMGVICTTLIITTVLLLYLLPYIAEGFYWHSYPVSAMLLGLIGLIVCAIAFLFGIGGLIFGKSGLKSPKKNLAIIGIMLSITGIVASIYFLSRLLR
ncbi:MAG: hypothetical protein C0412_16720 [Flavobacterium sp.]|nr:hypothetical protein [Flavobacterium sp.]